MTLEPQGRVRIPLTRRQLQARAFFPALAFGIPLLVYLLTMAPGLTWAHHGADGGDLITAAHTLGVPHPPGYPTYTLLAWSFTRLPLGNAAWRVNLLSSSSTAAAAALIYGTVRRLTRRDFGSKGSSGPWGDLVALATAWSYAFAPLVWSQALIAEVYAPGGLWTALILWWTSLAFRRRDGGSNRAALGLGLIWGLGLGIHLTLLALAPVVLWALFRPRALAFQRSRFAALGLLLALSIWLYLPLRAGRGGVTWGEPTNPAGLWWLVSGALYRDYALSLPLSALGGRLSAWGQVWGRGLGLIGIALMLWGIVSRPGEPKSRFGGWLVATGLSFVAFNLYAVGYDTTDSVVYLVPAFVIGSLWLGIGLGELVQQLEERGRWATAGVLVIALALPAWSLAQNWTALNLSDDREAEHFGLAVMEKAPPGAVLLTSTDRQTFALWYYHKVVGLRPDLVVIDVGLWGFNWYRMQLQQTHPDLFPKTQTTTDLINLTAERPQCQIRREAHAGWLDCQN